MVSKIMSSKVDRVFCCYRIYKRKRIRPSRGLIRPLRVTTLRQGVKTENMDPSIFQYDGHLFKYMHLHLYNVKAENTVDLMTSAFLQINLTLNLWCYRFKNFSESAIFHYLLLFFPPKSVNMGKYVMVISH